MRTITLFVGLTLAGTFGAEAVENPTTFPVLGGSFGQVMRVTVSALPPGPCVVAVSLNSGEGTPPEPIRILDLTPGQVGTTDLALSRLAPRLGARVEVLPVVRVLAGECSAAVETIELVTGRTTAYVKLFAGLGTPPEPVRPGEAAPPDPVTPGESAPPDPVFPAVAAVGGQVIRLAVARLGTPPDPITPGESVPPDPIRRCSGLLAFADARGTLVGTPRAVDLEPGQIAFVDVDPRALGAAGFGIGARRIAQPRLLLPASGGGDLSGCHASVQVFEKLTGWTSQIVSGR